MPRRRTRSARDRGAVTVEAAIALCALLVAFALILAGLGAVTDQLRCADAAGAAARLVARGEQQRAQAAVEAIGPAGARLAVGGVRRAGDTGGRAVPVTVTAEPVGGLLPGIQVRGLAYAVLEPGVSAPSAGGPDA